MTICCDTYNAALEQRIVWWKRHGTILDSRCAWHPLSGLDPTRSQTKQLQEARLELGIEIPAQLHNAVLVRLDDAFKAFNRRRRAGKPGGFPRFRRRRMWRTIVFPSYGQSHSWLGGTGRYARIRLSGIGEVRVRQHRHLPSGDLGRVTVTELPSGRWALTILVRSPALEPLTKTGRRVGLKRGVRHLVSTSDGLAVAGLTISQPVDREIASAQRALSRAQTGSKNYELTRMRLAKAYERAAADRSRRLGELARELTAVYDEIVIEDLSISEMIRAANGLAPGLARRVSEQGWSIFERRLRDRCERHGRRLIVVDQRDIAQTCPECGELTNQKFGKRRFSCDCCGHAEDRDVAAARVVLQRADEPGMIRERYPDGTGLLDSVPLTSSS